MIRGIIIYFLLFTLIEFVCNYPIEDLKDTVNPTELTVITTENQKDVSEGLHTENIYVTLNTESVIVPTSFKEENDKNDKEIGNKYVDIGVNNEHMNIDSVNVEENDKYTTDNGNIELKGVEVVDVSKHSGKSDTTEVYTKDKYSENNKKGKHDNNESDVYTKNTPVGKNDERSKINEDGDVYTDENGKIKIFGVEYKPEENENENSSSRCVNGTEYEMEIEVARELPPNIGFDLLQIILSDSEVIEKRSTDLENSESIINNPRDLEVAANTVFRPLFVYKRQNERRKFKPFPILGSN